jgi:hypothetical protein
VTKEVYKEVRIELKNGGLKFLGSYKTRSSRCQNPKFHLHRNLILADISKFGVGPPEILVNGDHEIPVYKMFRVSTGRDRTSNIPPSISVQGSYTICKVTELAAVEDLAISAGLIALPSVPGR